MVPHVLKTEADFKAAVARIDELMGAQEGTPELQELELLSLLVVAYEDEHEDIRLPDPIEFIRYRMEQQDLSIADIAPLFGGERLADKVLSGQRPLSVAMIRRLHRELGIPAEILIQESPRREASRVG